MHQEVPMPAIHLAVNRERPVNAVPIEDARFEQELAHVLWQNRSISVDHQAPQQWCSLGEQ